MDDVLAKIYAAKAANLETEMLREDYASLRLRALARGSRRRGFLAELRASDGAAIVAEIKRASPSAGIIAHSFNPVAIARSYEEAGVDAISVLTEPDFFLGALSFLDDVRAVTNRPILRKDFLSTPYQVAQSAAYGADCILLIVAGLSDDALSACMEEAAAYQLDVLVEVHDEAELHRAQALDANLIGVNNRNLRTMATDVAVSERLLPMIGPEAFAISESGLHDVADVLRVRRAGARGFLIGESLMRSSDVRDAITTLKAACARA